MISGDRIRQAREICKLTQSELAAAVGVEQSHISMIEADAREPSDSVIEAIALKTRFSPGFFRQPPGPEFPYGSLLYRKKKSASASDLARIRQFGRLAFEINEILSAKFKPRQITIPDVQDDPVKAAGLARASLGLSPDRPLSNLISSLENGGVAVIPSPYEIDEHDAFSAWAATEPRRPVIVYSPSKSGDRQRFSIAHEYGHLVMHRSPGGDYDLLEKEAHAFAGEFLFPSEAFKEEVRLPLTLTDLAEIKSRRGISMQAIVEHAFRIGVISPAQRKRIYVKMSSMGWRKKEPVEIPNEKARLLSKMAEMLYGTAYQPEALASNNLSPTPLISKLDRLYCKAAEIRTAPKEDHTKIVSLSDYRTRKE